MPTRRTGFGGKGFTFSEDEQNKLNEMKKTIAWVIRIIRFLIKIDIWITKF